MKRRAEGSDESRSVWMDPADQTHHPVLDRDLEVEVAIVGGGITGITATCLLARAGCSVALLERGRLAMSETGHTTGHIATVTDADPAILLRDLGDEGARSVTRAVRFSIEQIRSFVRELAIDCDLHEVEGYRYAATSGERRALRRARVLLERAGVECAWTERIPAPFPAHGALRFERQYLFHVLRYLRALAEEARARGARIFEYSPASAVLSANRQAGTVVRTRGGEVRAKHTILATHAPLDDKSAIWPMLRAMRTYVVAAPIRRGVISDAQYFDTLEPYHYTRLARGAKGLQLVVGGEDRAVGSRQNGVRRHEELERFAREKFGVRTFGLRWSGQIHESADGLPLIGPCPRRKHVWMATGYAGDGITYGTLAAMMLTDRIRGMVHPLSHVFDPARSASFRRKGATAGHGGPKPAPRRPGSRGIAAVREGQGRVVMVSHQARAISRVEGVVRVLDAKCSHLGCTVVWNAVERSWDCPCHGSRFHPDGEVLCAPASRALAPIPPNAKRKP